MPAKTPKKSVQTNTQTNTQTDIQSNLLPQNTRALRAKINLSRKCCSGVIFEIYIAEISAIALFAEALISSSMHEADLSAPSAPQN